MHPNALLDLGTELLRPVLKFDAPADSIVSDFFREHRALGPRERHTLAETTYTVLRQRLLFQHLAQSGKGEIERRLAILGWQGNEGFLRAALDDARAAMARAGAGGRPGDAAGEAAPQPARLAGRARCMASWASEFWPLVERSMRRRRWTCASTPSRPSATTCRRRWPTAGIEAEPTPFSPWGLRVAGKPALHKLDVFTRGDVEVQDEGSQLLALLIDAKRGEMVVDFCAGAGGKTLALGAAMRNTGRLYAFDISGHRLAALKPRLARSGLSNVYPAQIAHERDERIKRLAGKIDRVLVDAPCSGLGTLRRNPDLKWRQSPEGRGQELRVKQAPSWPARRGCSSRAAGWSTPPAACCGSENEASPRPSAAAGRDFRAAGRRRSCWRQAQVAERADAGRGGLPAAVAASARQRTASSPRCGERLDRRRIAANGAIACWRRLSSNRAFH